MRRSIALTVVAGLALTLGTAAAQVYSSAPGIPIPNTDTFALISDTITITNGPATIADLNINIQIEHEYDEDVHAVLQTPHGYINLTTSNGFGSDYLTTRFDDSAQLSITQGASPFNGSFRPEGLLNQWAEFDPNSAALFSGPNFRRLTELNGLSANGDWILYIEDFDTLFFTGSFNYWSLEFNYAADSNNPNPAPAPPTSPIAAVSVNYPVLSAGQRLSFSADVTPGFLPTPSTGLSVRVNASSLGLGTVILRDDGLDDDGIAGNNIFGASVLVNSALGTYPLSYTVSDSQGRSTSGALPTIQVIGPGPDCPPFEQAKSFADLRAFGGWNQDPDNSRAPLAFSGEGQITDIHLSGRLVSNLNGSSANEAGIAINFSDGTSNIFSIFPDANGEFSYIDAADVVLPLFQPRLPSEIVSIEVYDNFENPGLDETWQSLCLTYETRDLSPRINFAYSGAAAGEVGTTAEFFANVRTGFNPLSTSLIVQANLTPFGGPLVQLFDDGAHNDGDAGDGFYAGLATIPTNATLGSFDLTVSASDAQGRSDSTTVTLTIVGPVQWDESINADGDAGDLPPVAVTIAGSGPLTSLGGDITVGDTDMYQITICDPATFSINANDPRTTVDTQLWLFNTDGRGVEFNDDGPNGSASLLDNSFVTQPGQYLLAVTAYDLDALDEAGELLFESQPFRGVRAPTGPGGANPIASWGGFTFASGRYVLQLSGSCFVGATCDPDLNQDGNADQGDVDYIINVIAGGDNPTNIDPDFNQDGNSDQGDIDALVNVIAGGNCP